MAYESVADTAYIEYLSTLQNKASCAIESEMGCMFSLLAGNETAEESTIYDNIALEKAERNFKEKVSAAWKVFREKATAFFNKAVNTIKNLVARIQAKIVSKMVSDKKTYGLGNDKYEFLENISNIEKLFGKFKKDTKTVSISYNEEIIKELEKMIKIGDAKEEGVRTDRRQQLLQNNRKLIAVDGSVLKRWLDSIVNIISIGK